MVNESSGNMENVGHALNIFIFIPSSQSSSRNTSYLSACLQESQLGRGRRGLRWLPKTPCIRYGQVGQRDHEKKYS